MNHPAVTLPPKRLRAIAKIARQCSTKKEIYAKLKGAELDEAWRIKQIQNARWTARETALIGNCRYGSNDGYGLQGYYLSPQKLRTHERAGIRRSAWKTTRRWPMADLFRYAFAARLADKIKEGWTYDTMGKTHSLGLHHGKEVTIRCGRAACRYKVMYVSLQFDLLAQEAVWIGGLLTIRAKADGEKPDYDCDWLELRPGSPGLIVKKGRILNVNFHTEFDSKGRPRQRAINRPKASAPRPPRGWVNRDSSLRAGNCPNGTDHFIQTKLMPHLASQNIGGVTFQRVRDCCHRVEMILGLQRDTFMLRLQRAA